MFLFFTKYPILGAKGNDFKDFVKVMELIKIKEHLTENGLEKFSKMKQGINKGRTLKIKIE